MTDRPVVNLRDAELGSESGRPAGYRARGRQVGASLGAQMLDATIYELARGESLCPYRYEYGNEEWVLVLAGRPAVRGADGEEVLEPGDVVCFREGPAGAHRLSNREREPARILVLSTTNQPAVAIYPDSGKIGVRPPGKAFRESDAVDCWEGEASG